MINYLWFFAAAAFEIGGCYAFWAWLRLGKNPWWLIPGLICLALFALILTRVEAEFAGRAFAAYGGVYIVASLVWLSAVEQSKPLLSDGLGALLCLAGAGLILLGPHMHGA